MTTINWGLLGPEKLESERRTRTLGVGTVVRVFNDLAVPSLGGVKFSKSVFLSCLGIHIAEKVRATGKQIGNIQVTNAIEALACSLSFRQNNWQSDQRLKGNTNLAGKDDFSFKAFSANNFYVTHPMRMATVQTLPGLGLVESQGGRFNSYSLSSHGRNFVNAGCGELKCHGNRIIEFLVKWVKGDNRNPETAGLKLAIAQINDLPRDAKAILKDRLVTGNDEEASRRRNAITWVNNITEKPCPNWLQPTELTTEHFQDIKSGAHFFMLRDNVMNLLDAIETEVANSKTGNLKLNKGVPKSLSKALLKVKTAADNFVSLNHDPSPDKLATYLSNECLQSTDAMIISSMVERDNLVLKVRDKTIVKGPAFGGVQQELNEEKEVDGLFPKGVSYRLWNLYVLNLDLNNQLDTWLNNKGEADE
jgi:hypothetical protein